jgi:hypothetical protein
VRDAIPSYVHRGLSTQTRLLMNGVALAALVVFTPLAAAQTTYETPSTGGAAQPDTQGGALETQSGGAAGAGAGQLQEDTGSGTKQKSL